MNNCEKKFEKKIEKNFNNNLSTNMNTEDAIQEQLQEQLNSCHLRFKNNEIDKKVWKEEVDVIMGKMKEHLHNVIEKYYPPIKINFFDGSNMIYQCEDTITYNKIIEYIKEEKGKDKYTMVKLFKMGEEEEIKMPSSGDELFCLFKEAEKIEWTHKYANLDTDFNLDRLYNMMVDFVKQKTEEFYLEDYEEYKGDSKKIMDNIGDNVGEMFSCGTRYTYRAIKDCIGEYDDFFSKYDEDGDECSMLDIIDQYKYMTEFCKEVYDNWDLGDCDGITYPIHSNEFYECVCYALCYVAIENLTPKLPILGGFKKGLKFDNIKFEDIDGSDEYEDYKSFNTISIEFEEDVKDGEVMIKYNVIHEDEHASGGKRLKIYSPDPEYTMGYNHIKLVISRYNLDTENIYTINEIHITDEGHIEMVNGYDTDNTNYNWIWDIRC